MGRLSAAFASAHKPSPLCSSESQTKELPVAHRCSICKERIGLERLDGETEEAYILPCSHVFGSICITRWLECDSLHQNCPNCRRKMIYRTCGHAIKPCQITRAPKGVDEEDMPENCVVCRAGGLLGEQLRLRHERQEAEQKALEGMRLYLPVIFGGMCRTTVQSVDARSEESKDALRQDIDAVRAELEKGHREQW